MLEPTFNFIFDEVTKEIDSVTPDRNRAYTYIKRLNDVKPDIRKEYDTIRDNIKDKYMKFQEECPKAADTPKEKDKRRLLDRHKVAAAFMIAFMNKFKDNEANLSQELAAILIGQLILKIVISDENRNYKDNSILISIDRWGFRYPLCIRNTCGNYLYNWALGIHYGRLSGRLSVLSLSNELFWLERYNRDAIGNA